MSAMLPSVSDRTLGCNAHLGRTGELLPSGAPPQPSQSPACAFFSSFSRRSLPFSFSMSPSCHALIKSSLLPCLQFPCIHVSSLCFSPHSLCVHLPAFSPHPIFHLCLSLPIQLSFHNPSLFCSSHYFTPSSAVFTLPALLWFLSLASGL